LGFVGLNEAIAFACNGFNVVGYDIDGAKVDMLAAGKPPAGAANPQELEAALTSGHLHLTSTPADLKGSRAAIICVPTPVDSRGVPDLSMVCGATRDALDALQPPCLLVLTSTVPPGTTRKVVAALVEERGLRVGLDVFVVFAAERIDPNNRRFPFRRVPRVLAGTEEMATELGRRLYRRVVLKVHTTSTPEVAEMSKLVENCARMVNISLMNELAVLSNAWGIDIWEAIRAASTKPFGFLPHYPGAGVGGACIPVAPHYLLHPSGASNQGASLLRASMEINDRMPEYVAHRVEEMLALEKEDLDVLVVGVTYKPDVADIRESPGLRLVRVLQRLGRRVSYHDPLVPEVTVDGKLLTSTPLDSDHLSGSLVVLVTPHSSLDYQSLVAHAQRVFDTRDALGGFNNDKIVKM
jgi:UDP-N-acetyl-D-glucosamine dehydrogenase